MGEPVVSYSTLKVAQRVVSRNKKRDAKQLRHPVLQVVPRPTDLQRQAIEAQKQLSAISREFDLIRQGILRAIATNKDARSVEVAIRHELDICRSNGEPQISYFMQAYQIARDTLEKYAKQHEQKTGKKIVFAKSDLLNELELRDMPLDSIFVYLHSANRRRYNELGKRLETALLSLHAVREKIGRNNLLEGISDMEMAGNVMFMADIYSYAYYNAKKYIDWLQKLEQHAVKEDKHPKIGPQTPYASHEKPFWSVPVLPFSTNLLKSGGRDLLYAAHGTWVTKEEATGHYGLEKEQYLGRTEIDPAMIPLYGPAREVYKTAIIIKEGPDGMPLPPRTYDQQKGWVEGSVRKIAGRKIEFTYWNTHHAVSSSGEWEGGWEKRAEEIPPAGWKEYTWLIGNIIFTVLDAAFIAQTIIRGTARGIVARGMVRQPTGERLFFEAAKGLNDVQFTKFLQLAGRKGSWEIVERELLLLAGKGAITREVLMQYLEQQARRPAGLLGYLRSLRSKGILVDYAGNGLSAGLRAGYRRKATAEFFRELARNVDTKAVGELIQSLEAAGLGRQDKHMAMRALFSVATSFSKKAQVAFRELIAKPGAWDRLVKSIKKERMLGRIEQRATYPPQVEFAKGEATRRALSRLSPEYARALAYQPNKPMMELVAWVILAPQALGVLGKALEPKLLESEARKVEHGEYKKILQQVIEEARVLEEEMRKGRYK